jgi:hypothetical protein
MEDFKGEYTLVTLPRIVTPYRDSVDGTRDRVTYHPFDATAKYRQRTEQARNVTAYPTFDTLRGHESRPHRYDTR